VLYSSGQLIGWNEGCSFARDNVPIDPPAFSIDLDTVTAVATLKHDEPQHKFVLKLITPGEAALCEGETAEQTNAWCNAIKELCPSVK
jgi:hypothetical protein